MNKYEHLFIHIILLNWIMIIIFDNITDFKFFMFLLLNKLIK